MKSRVPCSLALVAALAVGVNGCRSSDQSQSDPRSPEQLALGLPLGTSLDSAVIADSRYGESSRTVEDALTYLNASQRDGVLHDSGGNEIHFETELIRKSGAIKKYPPSTVVIRLPD
jgi:hypothetical protein